MKTLSIILLCLMILVSEVGFTQQETADNSSATTASNISKSIVSDANVITPKTVSSDVFIASPVSVILGLFFIVFLIFAIAWMLRRMGAVSFMANQSMKVIASISVGAREKVILIEVGSKQILLGVAPGRVSYLQCFDEPVVNSTQSQEPEFSLKIKQFMQKGIGVHSVDESKDSSAK